MKTYSSSSAAQTRLDKSRQQSAGERIFSPRCCLCTERRKIAYTELGIREENEEEGFQI